MRKLKYTDIVLTIIALALTFLCWDRYQNRAVAHAADQQPQRVVVVGDGSDNPYVLPVALVGTSWSKQGGPSYADRSVPVTLTGIQKGQFAQWPSLDVQIKK
jgi:hypothetical protein